MRFEKELGLYVSGGEMPTAWKEIASTLTPDQLSLLFSFQRNPELLLDLLMDIPDETNFYVVDERECFKGILRTILRPRDVNGVVKYLGDELRAVVRICEQTYPDPSEEDIDHIMSTLAQSFPEHEADFRAVLEPHISAFFARKKAKQGQDVIEDDDEGYFVMESSPIDLELQDGIVDAIRALTDMACGSWQGERHFLQWAVGFYAKKPSEYVIHRDYISQYLSFLQDMIEDKIPYLAQAFTLFEHHIPSYYDPYRTTIRPLFKHIVQMIEVSKNEKTKGKRRFVGLIIGEIMKTVEGAADHYPMPIREDVRRDVIKDFLEKIHAFANAPDWILQPDRPTVNTMKWGFEINADRPLSFGERFLGYCNETKKVSEYVSVCTDDVKGTECLISGYLANGTTTELHLVSPLTLLLDKKSPKEGERWKTRCGLFADLIQGAGGLHGNHPSPAHHTPYVGTVHPDDRDLDLVEWVGFAETPCPIHKSERKEKPGLFDRGFAFVNGKWTPAFLIGTTETPVDPKTTNEKRTLYDFLTEPELLQWNDHAKKIEDGEEWNQDEVPEVGHFNYPIFVSHKNCPTLYTRPPKKGEVWRLANGGLSTILQDGIFPHKCAADDDDESRFEQLIGQYATVPFNPLDPDRGFWCIDPKVTTRANMKDSEVQEKDQHFLDELEKCLVVEQEESVVEEEKPSTFQVGDIVSRHNRKYVVSSIDKEESTTLVQCLVVEQEESVVEEEKPPTFQVGDIVSRHNRKYVVSSIDNKESTILVRELESRSPCKEIFIVATLRADDPDLEIVLSRPIPEGATFFGHRFKQHAINAAPCDCDYYTSKGTWERGRLLAAEGELFILLHDVTIIRNPAWSDVVF